MSEETERIPEETPVEVAPEANTDSVYEALEAVKKNAGGEQPEEEPEAADSEDEVPMTVDELKGVFQYIVGRIKTAGMKPVRRAGRAYMDSAERAVDWFADGLGTDDKKKGKG